MVAVTIDLARLDLDSVTLEIVDEAKTSPDHEFRLTLSLFRDMMLEVATAGARYAITQAEPVWEAHTERQVAGLRAALNQIVVKDVSHTADGSMSRIVEIPASVAYDVEQMAKAPRPVG